MDWLCGKKPCEKKTQISEEIDYFLNYYGSLRPSVYLSYERDAFGSRSDEDFRVTFDHRILCRQTDLRLGSDGGGTSLLPGGTVLMEVKCGGGIPLWMSRALTKEHIFQSSFSKYGTAYRQLIHPAGREVCAYA